MKSKEKIVKIMGVLLFGGFLALFNETIVNVALPKLMEELIVNAQTIQWLSTGYLLVIGILVPVTAFLIQKFTLKQLYIAAMSLCLLGTVIAATAPNFTFLLCGRLVQASGTGMLVPIMMNTIVVINPPEKRGAAVGLGLFVILFAPSIAPSISGVILQTLSWRYLFIIEIPLIIIALLLGYKYLEKVTELTNPKIDILSIILSTLGFGGIIMGFSSLGNKKASIFFIVGIIALILFSIRQFKLKEPMLDLRVLKSREYTLGVIFVMISMMTLFETLVVMPMYLEGVYHLTPLQVGIAILPAGLINAVTSIITGNIYDKLGAKKVVPFGFIILVVSFFLLSRVDVNTSYKTIIILLCILNVGTPLVMTSSQTNSLNQLKPREYPHGTAIINTVQQISAAMGSSLFVSLMTTRKNSYLSSIGGNVSSDQVAEAFTKGFNHTFLVGAIILLIGLLGSLMLFIRKSEKLEVIN
ncbi:MAG: DHA2 family efflux MFS transporter permease subunit [Clostridium sp.]|uniref:MDR family MFS transporter n=1 Tax=Clostridium sp. TaxID=1506 RepID=UPI003F2C5CBA